MYCQYSFIVLNSVIVLNQKQLSEYMKKILKIAWSKEWQKLTLSIKCTPTVNKKFPSMLKKKKIKFQTDVPCIGTWKWPISGYRIMMNRKHDPDLRAQHQEFSCHHPSCQTLRRDIRKSHSLYSQNTNSKGFVIKELSLPVDILRRLQGFGSIKRVLHVAKLQPLSFFGRVEICFRCFPIKIDFKLHRVLR